MSSSIFWKLLCLIYIANSVICADPPTLYEYYTGGGIKSGLVAEGNKFTLNGKDITIFSGSLHYFRVLPELWKDRLLKMKAAGLNAVQFYSSWNLHELHPGEFNFEGMLNVDKFLQTIKEVDMFAIFRPGPYICAEWDLGGYPSWLLRDPNMKLRSTYKPHEDAVEKYMTKLLNITKRHQFTDGGPIIAYQIENEFASFGNTKGNTNDKQYIEFLKNLFTTNGVKELLFTSDNSATDHGNIPGPLITINFGSNPKGNLENLHKLQPNRPLYVAEFWSGWFDKWGESHHRVASNSYETMYETIIFQMNSSVNNYMFHGGTNFGFTAGGDIVTSYDYDCPLTEWGDYTEKYKLQKALIERFIKERGLPKLKTIEPPAQSPKGNYGSVKLTDYVPFSEILNHVKAIESNQTYNMENLPLGSNYGQNFGLINYQTNISKSSKLKLIGGLSNRGIVLIDGEYYKVLNGSTKDIEVDLSQFKFSNATQHTLEILVEHMGRANYGTAINTARKGLFGQVEVDGVQHKKWKIYPLEFEQSFFKGLTTVKWKAYQSISAPGLFHGILEITDEPKDTFLKLDKWEKGVAFINGFNLGRYWNAGPQRELYVPSPLLKKGKNDVHIFELHSSTSTVEFVDKPNLG